MSIIVADTLKARVAGAAVTTTEGLNVGGACTATSFVGNVTGNASGTAGGLTGTPSITVGTVNATNITASGTLTYEDVTNVDSIGIVTARGGLEVGAAGVGATITSAGNAIISGFSTFKNDVTFTGASYNAVWDKSQNRLEFADNAALMLGTGEDLLLYTNGSNSIIDHSGDGDLLVRSLGSAEMIMLQAAGHIALKTSRTPSSMKDSIICYASGSVDIYYNDSIKFQTHNTGVNVTGIATISSDAFVGAAITMYASSGIVSATSFSGDGSNLSGIAGGLQESDLWTITADSTNTNWDDRDNDVLGGGSFGVSIARCTTTQNALFAKQGTGMSYSAGVFSFPSTGTYEVSANLFFRPSESSYKLTELFMQLTVNNSSYSTISKTYFYSQNNDSNPIILAPIQLTVTDTTNQKIRFTAFSDSNNMFFKGATDVIFSSFSFKKLA